MLKRTRGILLLCLIVATGMAGTIGEGTITATERKGLITLLKEGRQQLKPFLPEKITEKQWRYIPAGDSVNLGTYYQRLLQTELHMQRVITELNSAEMSRENRDSIVLGDDALLLLSENILGNISGNSDYKGDFKTVRQQNIVYIRTSTDHLRFKLVNTPLGKVDGYQYLYAAALHSKKLADKIAVMLSDSRFQQVRNTME